MKTSLCVLALFCSASTNAVGLKPLWKINVGKAYTLSAGRDSLLVHGSKWIVIDAKSGTRIATEECVNAGFATDKIWILRKGETVQAFLDQPQIEKGVLEVWQPVPWRKLWDVSVQGQGGAEGDILGNYLFYVDDLGLHRYRISTKENEETRVTGWRGWPTGIKATSRRVYVNVDGHEVYGLDSLHLSSGWRNYCDCKVSFADELGFVGTGTCGYRLAIVSPDGKNAFENGDYSSGHYQFARVTPAVTKGYVITGAILVKYVQSNSVDESRVRIMSPYLLGLSRAAGKIVWKVPMGTTTGGYLEGPDPVIIGNCVAAFGANRMGKHYAWTLQLRDIATGRLRWRSAPMKVGYYTYTRLASNGELVFELNDGILQAYRVRS